jgi:hypothetical protein
MSPSEDDGCDTVTENGNDSDVEETLQPVDVRVPFRSLSNKAIEYHTSLGDLETKSLLVKVLNEARPKPSVVGVKR